MAKQDNIKDIMNMINIATKIIFYTILFTLIATRTVEAMSLIRLGLCSATSKGVKYLVR